MSDNDIIDKNCEDNFVKYLLAVNETKRRCFEGAFSLLYLAWGGANRYERLYDFCTEVLGWKKQDLKNLLCEAQMRHISVSSGSRCYSSSYSKPSTPCTPRSLGENSAFFEDRSVFEDFRSSHSLKQSQQNGVVAQAQSSSSETEGHSICASPHVENSTAFENSEFSGVGGSISIRSNSDDDSQCNREVIKKVEHEGSCKSGPGGKLTSEELQSDKELNKKGQCDQTKQSSKNSKARSSQSLNHDDSPELKRTQSVLLNSFKKLFNLSSQSVNSLGASSQKSSNNEEDFIDVKPETLIQVGKEPVQTATSISQPLSEVAYMTHPVQKATQIIQDVHSELQRNKESELEKIKQEKYGHGSIEENLLEPNSAQIDTIAESPLVLKSVQECSEVQVPNNPLEIPSIAKEAVHEMHYNPDDPFELDQAQDILSCFMLKSRIDPGKLPERVLVLMLTEIFPKLPPLVTQYVSRMKHLSYVVCYLDYDFDNAFLKMKLDELLVLASDLISTVVESCKAITEKQLKENSRKFRSSKRRLRSARKSYYEHLNFVERTREDLREAEKEYQKAQERQSKLETDSPQDCVPPDETNTAATANEIRSVSRSASLVDFDEVYPEEGDSQTSGSLLTSVMEEVVIGRKPRRESVLFRRKFSRNSQDVIHVKRGFRNSLRSNVSAEQEFVVKGDLLSERQAERNRLSRQIKRLRKSESRICNDELLIKQHIKASLDAYTEGGLDESASIKGRLRVTEIRNGNFGKFLISARMEAIKFASNVTVFDMKEWLMKKKYSTCEVQQVFSQLKVKHSKENVGIFDILDIDGSGPSVIVLSGPKGCGKTFMCYYILHQWKLQKHIVNSKIHEFDIVLYVTLDSILSSGSWYQYLRDHVFPETLSEFPYTDIYESFSRLTLLILLDVNVVSTTGITVLNDMLKKLGHNKLVVAVRCGNISEITEVIRSNDLSFIKAKFCSMTSEAITEYSSQLVSLSGSRNEKEVMQFAEMLRSSRCLTTLKYPLYVTYLFYLWLVNPSHVQHSTTVSRLFTQVTLTCQQSLMDARKNDPDDEKIKNKKVVQDYISQLCEAAWKLMTEENWKVENLVLFREDDGPCKDPAIWSYFHPFIFVREAPGKRQGVLLHSSLAEVLSGFYLASKLLSQKKSLFNKRSKLESYLQLDVKRYRDVLLHVAGVLVYNKHNAEDAKEIVLNYGKILSGGDFSSWFELLKECDFMSSLCTSVANELMQYTTWSVANYSKEKNLIVADLLRKGAYQPKQVIISNSEEKDGEDSQGVRYIISALSTCTATLVHLRQELQFYTWGDKTTCDVQVIPLQPPGTLQNCWGHLGVEGAMALRHSHHLEELYVRISSCEALAALSNCLVHLQQTLRFLYLRLDLPATTPSSSFHPLNFKGKKFWFRLRNINDSSVIWVIDTVNRLNNWYTEVVLEESNLSPASLHNLKESLPHISIHVSN
ncbi:uncharacterized protein LOC135217136 [Macrobrachium nipponense]|uniref:uncharacterized protein LOC135217136 n=1 Tax=Macrobrachium nipponense TaxID=159736 RepID=UPI0030C7D942